VSKEKDTRAFRRGYKKGLDDMAFDARKAWREWYLSLPLDLQEALSEHEGHRRQRFVWNQGLKYGPDYEFDWS